MTFSHHLDQRLAWETLQVSSEAIPADLPGLRPRRGFKQEFVILRNVHAVPSRSRESTQRYE